jgi:hypothetical protein
MMNYGDRLKMDNNDKDWFVELGLVRDQAKILEWGLEKFPHFAKNKNLIAQLWYTQVLGKVLPTLQTIVSVEDLRKKAKEFADAGELKTADGKDKRVWGSIEVMVVGPLGDGRPYFGCPKCLRGIDKNIGVCINENVEYGHPGEEIEGQSLTWQNWQTGDSTGEVVITFSPNKKQTPHTIQGNILTLSGSLSLRDGRYTVWEIVKNKHSGVKMGTPLKNTTPEPAVEVPELEIVESENIDVGEVVVEQKIEKDETELFDEEEDIGAELFEGLGEVGSETTEGEIESRIIGFKVLEKRFKNALKRYVGKKVVESEVMIKWLLVQPQLRTVPDNENLANSFLVAMADKGYIAVDEKNKLTCLVGV